MIENYLSAGASNPDLTLNKIWAILDKHYGCPLKVSHALQKKLQAFPSIRHTNIGLKLQDLLYLCRSIDANMIGNVELHIFNLSSGQQLVWSKFPEWLQVKWRSRGHKYSADNPGSLPSFSYLTEFLQVTVDELLDPNYDKKTWNVSKSIHTLKTETSNQEELPSSFNTLKTEISSKEEKCVYHDIGGHSIVNCRTFSKLPYQERRNFVKEKRLCFKCMGPHTIKMCSSNIKCSTCGKNHSTLLHFTKHNEASDFGRHDGYKRPSESVVGKNDSKFRSGNISSRNNYEHEKTN